MHLYLFEWICLFVQLNEQFKNWLKDRLLPPRCGEIMKVFWLTARLEHARRWNIYRKKSLVSQIRGAELTVLYIYIYIYVNNRLTIWFSGLCFVMWNVILSFSSIYLTSCFTAIWFWFHGFLNITLLDRNTYTQIYIYGGNTAYRTIEPLKITAREIPSPRLIHQPNFWHQSNSVEGYVFKCIKIQCFKFSQMYFYVKSRAIFYFPSEGKKS